MLLSITVQNLGFFLFLVARNVWAIDINTFLKYTSDTKRELLQTNSNESCYIQARRLFTGIENGEGWALKLLDASGSIPSGMYSGNAFDFGYFDQCLGISEFDENGEIKGKYCHKALFIPLEEFLEKKLTSSNATTRGKVIERTKWKRIGTLSWAARTSPEGLDDLGYEPSFVILSVCIPHKCNPSNIFGTYGIDGECTALENNYQLDSADLSFLVFLGVIFFMIITSTAYDWYLHDFGKETLYPVLLTFSLYSNGEKIFQSSHASSGQIKCFNGLKVISLLWVIAGHRFMMYNMSEGIVRNSIDIYSWSGKWYAVYITTAPLAVDTFFFVSGALVALIFLRQMNKPEAKFNFLQYCNHRYLRLTPPVLVLYFFHVTIARRLGSGPTWNANFDQIQQACLNNWWQFLTYIQNYTPHKMTCLGHTWYISLDMQAFILSPLLLIPVAKYPKVAIHGLLPFVLAVSILTPVIIIYIFDIKYYTPQYFGMYYFFTHNRLAPYVIGLAFGIFLFKKPLGESKMTISRKIHLTAWGSVLTIMGVIMLSLNNVVENGDTIETAFYMGLNRPAWAVCLCWISFACIYGYGGIINWFLSSTIFEVLAKFCYSSYLVHVTIIMISINQQRFPDYFSDYEALYKICGDVVFTLVLGVLWTFSFEYPVLEIERAILGRGSKNPTNVSNNEATLNDNALEDVHIPAYDTKSKL